MAIGRVPGATGIQPSIVDAKGDLIAATAADSVSRLAAGSNNQVLMADSAQATGLKYANEATATLTTTGDILYASAANTPARLGIGSTDQVLKVSGGVPVWAADTNKVVQIVYGSTSTGVGSAVSTFADTNLSATITPTSASNKVLIMYSQNGCHKYNANTRLQIRLMRGSTVILNAESFAGNNDGSGGNAFGSSSAVYLDSPATTSATTYKTQFANQAAAGTVYVNDTTSPGSTSTMILMEVTP